MGFWDIIFGPNNNKKVLWRLNQIMGRLDAVKAALDLAGSTAAAIEPRLIHLVNHRGKHV